jgi:hypothetical protein
MRCGEQIPQSIREPWLSAKYYDSIPSPARALPGNSADTPRDVRTNVPGWPRLSNQGYVDAQVAFDLAMKPRPTDI